VGFYFAAEGATQTGSLETTLGSASVPSLRTDGFHSEGDKNPICGHAFAIRAGVDSVMLETVLMLTGLASCVVILIAFWGTDLLQMRRRRE
jgi:hypothetical protein